MAIKSLFSKLTIVTIVAQALGAIINGLLITLLARKLNGNDFQLYVATVSLVTVFGSFTLGIKTLTAYDYARSKKQAADSLEILR